MHAVLYQYLLVSDGKEMSEHRAAAQHGVARDSVEEELEQLPPRLEEALVKAALWYMCTCEEKSKPVAEREVAESERKKNRD